MKKHNNQRLPTILLATIATIFIFCAFGSTFAQNGIGEKYGSRDPKTCADKTLPKTGAPSSAQAAQYVVCGHERVLTVLYLDEDVKVQVGKGRPYNMKEDYNVPNIDVRVPVYPIRGSLRQYSCDPLRTDRSNLNRNCSIYTAPNATGLCYKDTFGDWHCGMNDARTGDFTDRNVPPPGAGATAATKDEKTAPQNKNQPNKNAPPTDNKNEAADDKDENGFPKVDFTALDKWYDIVKYEYDSTGSYMYLYVKPKADEARETQFFIEFTDKNGIVYDRTWTQFLHMPGRYDAQPGDTVKAQISLPPQSFMKDVVSAKAMVRPHY